MAKNSLNPYVVNRHNEKVDISFDQIINRINDLCKPIGNHPSLDQIDIINITQQVIGKFRNGMKTSEIDAMLISICVNHPSYTLDYEK